MALFALAGGLRASGLSEGANQEEVSRASVRTDSPADQERGGEVAGEDSPRYRYDWHTRSGVEVEGARRGKTLSFEVVRLNSLCYDYSITSEQVRATVRTSPWFSLLGDGDPSGLLQTLLRGDSVRRPLEDMGGQDPPADEATAGDTERIRARREIERARDSLRVARGALTLLARRQDSAVEIVEGAYDRACRAGVPSETVERWWDDHGAVLRALDEEGASLLERAGRTRGAASILLDGARGLTGEGMPDVDSLYRLAQDEAEKIEAAADLLATERRRTLAARDGIKAALGVTRRVVSIPVGRNTQRIRVMIRAEGKDSLPDGFSVRSQEETVVVDVERRSRFFLSSGFMISTLRAADFERTTLPVPQPRDTLMFPGDSETFSTFVNRSDGSEVAVAPVLMSTVALFWDDPIALGLSAGLAPRTVDNATGLDFLFGVTGIFGDLLTTTVAFHQGRVERLILGDPAEVASRPVPADVTDDSAVGVEWEQAVAFMVGIVLPP